MFLKYTITHVNIFSSSDIKLENSTSDNIYAFLESQFYTMGVKPIWITKALDLVPYANGISI